MSSRRRIFRARPVSPPNNDFAEGSSNNTRNLNERNAMSNRGRHMNAYLGNSSPGNTNRAFAMWNDANFGNLANNLNGGAAVIGASNRRNAAPRVYVNANRRLNPNFNVGVLTNVESPPSRQCVQLAASQGIRSAAFQDCLEMHLRTINGAVKATKNTVCSGSQMNLPQYRTHELAKIIATGETTSRGQVVWTNTGGGKTLTSLAILLAYWDSGKRLFVATTPDNRSSNSPTEYIKYLRKYFPRAYEAIQRQYPGKNLTNVFSDKNLNAKVCFLTFTLFKHSLGINDSGTSHDYARYKAAFGVDPDSPPHQQKACKLWNVNDRLGSIVVFDEAHGLIKPDPGMQNVSLTLRSLTARQRQGLHIWALTATPGANVHEWLQLLSIVRRVDTDLDLARCAGDLTRWMTASNASRIDTFFANNVDGLIAFNETRGNLKDHACVKAFSFPVPMDRWYYMSYLNALDQLDDPQRARLGLFLHRTEYDKLAPKEIKTIISEKERRVLGSKGQWVSYKFLMLVRFLAKYGGKQFVYTSTSVPELKEALETWYGYTDVTDDVMGAESYTRRGKHFVVLPGIVARGRKQLTAEQKGRLFDAINSDDNKSGAVIKIVIAGGQAFEGTNIRALRAVHVAEPMGDALRERQLVGRGVRFCGHEQLPPADRNVAIVRWYAMPPSTATRNIMTKGALRLHAGSGKKLPMIRFKNTSQTLTKALDRIHATAKQLGKKGWEYAFREKSLAGKDAVLLSSFEQYVAQRAVGNRKKFVLLQRFRIVPGRTCRGAKNIVGKK